VSGHTARPRDKQGTSDEEHVVDDGASVTEPVAQLDRLVQRSAARIVMIMQDTRARRGRTLELCFLEPPDMALLSPSRRPSLLAPISFR
jgi:hypothetical protein